MRFVSSVASLLLAAAATTTAAEAATCSQWRSTCESRGGGSACDAKFAKCMKDGTFTEGEKWGGKTHTGVTKK